MCHQQDQASPHYHHDVRAYLDNAFLTGCRGSVENPPCNFFLWGYLKDTGYSIKPETLQELWQEIGLVELSQQQFGGHLSVSYSLLSIVPQG
jgi:hypothetical protein